MEGGGFLAFKKANEKNLLPKLLQNRKLTLDIKTFFAIPVLSNFLLYFYFQHKTLTPKTYKNFPLFCPNINKIVAARYLEQLEAKIDENIFDQTPPEILKHMVEEQNFSFSEKLNNSVEAMKINFIDFFYRDQKINKLLFIYDNLLGMIRKYPGILNRTISLRDLHHKSNEHLHWLLRLHGELETDAGLPLSYIWSDFSDGSDKVICRDLSEVLKIKNSEPIYMQKDEYNSEVKRTITIKEAYKYIIDDIAKGYFRNKEENELKDLLNHILDKKIRKNFIEKSIEYVNFLKSENKLESENKAQIIIFLLRYKEEKELN